MRRLCFVLALLLISNETLAQNMIPAAGCIALPAEHADTQVTRATVCIAWLLYPTTSPGKDETTGQSKKTETEKQNKKDKLDVNGPVTAQAAPK